jgi:hypothetical protein
MRVSEYFCARMRCLDLIEEIPAVKICPDDCELADYYAAKGIEPPQKQARTFLAGMHGS